MNERKINLDDDYIKFIRLAEYHINKTGKGVVAMITNNSFLDGVTHRQMRKHLLETFDTIYIVDLHGSAKKQEKSPDGSPDKNVFDIMQGVCIFIMVKDGKNKQVLAEVNHLDMFGSRNDKYEKLWNYSLKTAPFEKLDYKEPYFFFAKKEFTHQNDYISFFGLDDLFAENASGITTERDDLVIQFDEDKLNEIKNAMLKMPLDEFRAKYNNKPDGRDWTLANAKEDLKTNKPDAIKFCYRPFDSRFTYYTGKTKGIHAYPRSNIMDNIANKQNICLTFTRQDRQLSLGYFFISNKITERHFLDSAADAMVVAPLYLYPTEQKPQDTLFSGEAPTRTPNLDMKIVQEIAKALNLPFMGDHEDKAKGDTSCFSPLDLLDYIYAILHSPSYRETYKEFLKIDFPRVPYPTPQTFWQLVEKGGELRQLHLLEGDAFKKPTTSFSVQGENIIEKIKYDTGKVYINDTQYFDGVSETAWNFYIGGYQPAQKWLKDRKTRELKFEDIRHYFKIITSLCETDKVMKEIDSIL